MILSCLFRSFFFTLIQCAYTTHNATWILTELNSSFTDLTNVASSCQLHEKATGGHVLLTSHLQIF